MRAKALLCALVPLALLAIGVAGCGGLAGERRDIECECSHCDDWQEEELKAALDASLDIAEAYLCDIEWEDLMLCEIDEGECDEDAARWTVREPGSCDSTMDTMLPCATAAECFDPSATCTGGTCRVKSCSGGGGPCTSDDQCPFGDDRCEKERDNLNDCIGDSSEHNGVSLDFD